jgi:hypothetical protein
MNKSSRRRLVGYHVLWKSPIGWERVATIGLADNPFDVIDGAKRGSGEWWIRGIWKQQDAGDNSNGR